MASPGIEFGLLLHTRHLIRDREGPSQVEELWDTSIHAEEIGFDHLWVGDSPRLSMIDKAHADCLTIMAALAAKTNKLKIGTVPLIVALRNPVLLAHTLGTLDVISSGRIVLGVAVAPTYNAEQEFEACGVPFHQRAGRLNESIQVMRRLWTEQSFAFKGKYYRFGEIGIQPKPGKTIPIWIAAADNENALQRVARLGDGWFTVAHTLEEFVTRRQKIDDYARQFGRKKRLAASALFTSFHLDHNGERAEEEGWAHAESYFQRPRSQLNYLCAFFGTPEQCARRLQGYVNAGLTAIVARFVSPDLQGQMELLLKELKPRLSPQPRL